MTDESLSQAPAEPTPDIVPDDQANNPAGIVSHRDQFSEPEPGEPIGRPLPQVTSSVPPSGPIPSLHAARTVEKPQPTYRTINALRIEEITAGLHGGVMLRVTTLFEENREWLVWSIRSVTQVPELSQRSVNQVPLRTVANDLFGAPADRHGYDLTSETGWNGYLQDVVFPVIEWLEESWVGSHAKHVTNPVSEFFYGEQGLLRLASYRDMVLRRMAERTAETTIAQQIKYEGPGLVIVVEDK